MNKSTEEVLSKIENIFRLANDKGATEGEINAALKKVHVLLKKHGLSMEDLRTAEKQTERNITSESFFQGRWQRWVNTLAHAMVELCHVKVHIQSIHRAKIGFFTGEENDIAIAKSMYSVLVQCMNSAAKRESQWDASYVYADRGERKQWTYAFKVGFTQAVYNRVQQQRQEEQVEAQKKITEENQKWELVIQDKEKAIEIWREQNLNLGKASKAVFARINCYGAYQTGQREGEKVDLNFKNKIA